MDTNAITKTIISKLKHKIFGKSPYGNKKWEMADDNWYNEIHNQNYLLHQDFMKYLRDKKDVKTILEIGCGTGIYPIKYKNLFVDKKYTGIDFSKSNIEFCKKRSNFMFICDDFLKMELTQRYDLVFSHAVIDHVYEIDEFLRRIAKICKKYAYINSYRGYFPNLIDHKMNWRDEDGCYYNDVSPRKAQQILVQAGVKLEEIIIKKVENGQINGKKWDETVIEINRPT